MAVTAAAVKKNPAQDRDVVEGADGCAAAGATRARADDRFVAGQARDADVEKAAEGKAEEDSGDGDEQGQEVAPLQL
jgi:hypothetical protein